MIVAVPSEFFAATLARLGPVTAPVVSATKGFEPARHRRMSEVVSRALAGDGGGGALGADLRPRGRARPADGGGRSPRATTRSRPTCSAAWARASSGSTPTATSSASRWAAPLKNVIALATGLADGLGLGENARAALVTRGLAEITRLAVALGGEPATLAGLAGLGDLVLTATGTLSRNRALGMALARGESRADAQRATRMVAEGVPTVASALALAQRHGVALPIAAEVAAVLFDGKSPAEALASLLGRAATREDARVGDRHA